jgi:hypothetical protein
VAQLAAAIRRRPAREGRRRQLLHVHVINWLRSLPYVRAWDEAYRDHGLVTIGVHTPEFSFEHAHGSDVDADGAGVVTYPRMYQLIRQEGPIGDRRFEIEFLDRGAQALCFTFG